MTRAAVYARISRDREGLELGVKRQERDCRELAERRGWDVVNVFVDDDISAYSKRHRPAYEAMMTAAKAGEFDAIVAYSTSRLYRRVMNLEAIIEDIDAAKVQIATVVAGQIDLSTASGKRMARINAAIAEGESEETSERIKRKFREKREKGEWTGGGSQAYGYAADRATVIEEEAVIIREMARRVLAGESTFGIAADLTRRGVPSATGGRWQSIRVKRILRSGRIAGRLELGHVDIGKAAWPAIIDEATAIRLRAALPDGTAPARQRHLLSGVLHCTACGGSMFSGGSSGSGKQLIYACRRDMGGCGTTIRARNVEALVIDALMPRLDAAPLMHTHEPEDPDVARIAEARAQIVAIGEQRLSPTSLPAMLAPWERQIEEAERRLTAKRPQDYRKMVAIYSTWFKGDAGRWEKLTPEQQRVIVASLIDRVDVEPAVRATRVFRPDRVKIHWR